MQRKIKNMFVVSQLKKILVWSKIVGGDTRVHPKMLYIITYFSYRNEMVKFYMQYRREFYANSKGI